MNSPPEVVAAENDQSRRNLARVVDALFLSSLERFRSRGPFLAWVYKPKMLRFLVSWHVADARFREQMKHWRELACCSICIAMFGSFSPRTNICATAGSGLKTEDSWRRARRTLPTRCCVDWLKPPNACPTPAKRLRPDHASMHQGSIPCTYRSVLMVRA